MTGSPADQRGSISARRILAPGGGWAGPATVHFAAGRIAGVTQGGDGGGTLTPGLIDLHNNGAFGVDFATAGRQEWRSALLQLAQCGVTAVQPTMITAPLPDIAAAMARMAEAADALAHQPVAQIVGAHLEGPFLAEARRGAHRADWLADPSPAALDALLQHGPTRRMLRTLTLAPERHGATAAISRLAQLGITVSLGHADADAAQGLEGVAAGATMVTHLFNAMRPFGHRDPALAGVALTDPRLWCCLIVDGIHVDPIGCRLAFAAAGERLVAVSDSILVAGLPMGAQRTFGGATVTVGHDGAGRRSDGTLSGAGIVLDEGVRRMIAAGIDPAAMLRAATEAPARALGRDDLGRIVAGARADLVLWDEAWMPRRVWVGGVEVSTV